MDNTDNSSVQPRVKPRGGLAILSQAVLFIVSVWAIYVSTAPLYRARKSLLTFVPPSGIVPD